jgi:two-component system KDP operon response regulator KdpE
MNLKAGGQPDRDAALTGLDVLIVEDDGELASMLDTVLRAEGFTVRRACTLASALEQVKHALPHLVILDLTLPDGQGSTWFGLWDDQRRVPTLVVSARSEERQKIALLDAGADDYLVKPFGVGELLARIRVALRHRQADPPHAVTRYRKDGLEVDLEQRRAQRDGMPIQLTPTEFDILACLVRKAGRVVTHRQLLADVWGPEYVEHTHYLRVYVGSLRAKIEPVPTEPRFVLTEVGVGYRLINE